MPIHLPKPAIMANLKRLPAPNTDAWDWQMNAACREIDNSLFFHPERERGSARQERDSRAKRICHSCPVIMACRRHALDAREPYGIWGGLTIDERKALVHQSERTF